MKHAVRRTEYERQGGLEGQRSASEPRYLIVGRVAGAHGLRGELKVDVLTDDPNRFSRLGQVFLGYEDDLPRAWILEGYRLHQERVLLTVQGCNDRVQAQAMRGLLVQIPVEDALPLEDGDYYEHQIIGLEVWTAEGDRLGVLSEIIYTGANDVYVVPGAGSKGRELLIPAIEGVVVEVDLEQGRLVVDLLEGLV